MYIDTKTIKKAKSFLLDLGRRLRQHTGEPRSTSYLIQRISMAIQKGNAVAMMGSLPHGKGTGRTVTIVILVSIVFIPSIYFILKKKKIILH